MDPLEEGARLIPHRLPRRQAGVQVDMGLNKGGQGQLAGAVDHLLPRPGGEAGGNFLETAVRYPDVRSLRRVFDVYAFDQHNDVRLSLLFVIN